jgi:hypothetical protein
MGVFSNIKDKLADKLDSNTKIQEVHEYPAIKFNGFPSATIVPSDNENDFETTTENQRNYAFQVRIFESIKNDNLNTAYETMYDLIDDVLDDFDKDQSLAGVTMPTGYTMVIVEAVPSTVGIVDRLDLLMSMITVKVRVLVDTQQIS